MYLKLLNFILKHNEICSRNNQGSIGTPLQKLYRVYLSLLKTAFPQISGITSQTDYLRIRKQMVLINLMILTKIEKVQIHKTTGFCQPTLKYLAPEKTLSMSKKLHG